MPNPLARLFHSRDKPTNAVSPALTFMFGGSPAGKAVNPRTAMQMTTVYACVRVIAETIVSLPLHVYKTVELGSEKATEHSLYRLLHDEPKDEMTSFQYREAMMAHLLLWGNSYSQILLRNGRGQAIGLYPLLPEHMNGLGAVQPTSCIVTETLNGDWELEMTHPIDDFGKWRRLDYGYIIRAPVPASYTPRVKMTVEGESTSTMIYKVSTNGGRLGFGWAWYSVATVASVTSKPSTYGFLLNIPISGTAETHQLYFVQNGGAIYHRGGNASGWATAWKLLYDSSHVMPEGFEVGAMHEEFAL